jgi:hypothetical protein
MQKTQNTNINNQTKLNFVFPLFESEETTVDEQLTVISSNLIFMKKLVNEPSEELLIQYNKKLESENEFDFYYYKKQNMNTNYSFFTSKKYQHYGYNSRSLFIKSNNYSMHQLRIKLAQNIYNVIVQTLVEYSDNYNQLVFERFENWYEVNSNKPISKKSPDYYEADDNKLFAKLFEKIDKIKSNDLSAEAA